MLPSRFLAGVLAFLATAASAQLSAPLDPDWRETDVPKPPPLRTTGLVDIEVPRSTLRFGVDPASVSLGTDRIVRYVVVAQSASGAVNAMYEGIRCKTAEAKVYARHTPGSGWVATTDPQWQPLHEGQHARYSLAIARSGVCMGNAPNRSPAQIVRDLKAPADSRYATETR